METLDLSRRGVLLNDEQLGPYPLEKLKRVERLTVDIVEDSPRVDEKEMAFAKCRLGGFGDVLKKRMEDFTVRVPIGASYYHFQKYLNDYPENEVAPEKAPLPEDTRIVTRHIKKDGLFHWGGDGGSVRGAPGCVLRHQGGRHAGGAGLPIRGGVSGTHPVAHHCGLPRGRVAG